jgi:hypothetical protein
MSIELVRTPARDTVTVRDGGELLEHLLAAYQCLMAAHGASLLRDEVALLESLRSRLRRDGSVELTVRTAALLARSFEDAAVSTVDPMSAAVFMEEAHVLRTRVL